jgi:hypothetical protein
VQNKSAYLCRYFKELDIAVQANKWLKLQPGDLDLLRSLRDIILLDTENLQDPATTDRDRKMEEKLRAFVKMPDAVNRLFNLTDNQRKKSKCTKN